MAKVAALSVQELYKLITSHSSMPACLEIIRLSFLHTDMYSFYHVVTHFTLRYCSFKRYFYHVMNYHYRNTMHYWSSISSFKQHATLGYFFFKHTCHQYLLIFASVSCGGEAKKN